MVSDKKRQSGILLHVTSLPGNFGIGDIGPGAYYFVDLLEEMGQKLWQILPTNPPSDNSYSPYSTDSAFANNTLLISLEELKKDGLLSDNDLSNYPSCSKDRLEFDKIVKTHSLLINKAISNFKKHNKTNKKYQKFCENNKDWLNNYAAFCYLSEKFKTTNWTIWDSRYRIYNKQTINDFINSKRSALNKFKIAQFLFFDQWQNLKKYSNRKGIKIIGDIPIYVSHYSSDVWSNQSLFKIDKDGKMIKQSGCPPDFFEANGQVWGHPIYNWEEHEKRKFKWWINRIKHLSSMIDIIRIDHFNGFAKYWEIPARDNNGLNGIWINAPGNAFFKMLFNDIGQCEIFAENLGEAASEADPILKKYDIPGMMVLQFCFGDAEKEPQINPELVLYTGTHDNDTAVGWFDHLLCNIDKTSKDKFSIEKGRVRDILKSDGIEINWDMIKYAYRSVANTVIIPMQDLLGLDSSARMNVPGTVNKKNWTWRFDPDLLSKDKKDRLFNLTSESGRI
ncbi:MAG: 4-alpha-glucanotransferase [Candidatus Marinimicrobia bacterium]|nr:4-alpha-glucanotransferase [Candidatus Neomarinimicrobiota bacterium]